MTKLVEGPQIIGSVFNAQTGSPMAGVAVTPLGTVFSDSTLIDQLSSLTTNSLGQFTCYAAPGVYPFATTEPLAAPIEPIEILTSAASTADIALQFANERARADASYVPLDGTDGTVSIDRSFTAPYSSVRPVLDTMVTTTSAIGDPSKRRAAIQATASDGNTVNQVNITAATNASPIVVTAAAHGYATGNAVVVQNVAGNTAANGAWTITRIDANMFSLNGSTGNAAYTSGGWVTNRSMMSGIVVNVTALVARGGMSGGQANGDDADGVTVQNSGSAIATDAFYVAASPAIAGDAWGAAYGHDGKATFGLHANGTYSDAAAFLGGDLKFGASGTSIGDLRLRRTAAGALTIDNPGGGTTIVTLNGSLNATIGMEIGKQDGTTSSPIIDFHSGATVVDYDARIIATGGDGTIGHGSLFFIAANLGFFGAAAVARQTLAAAASDAATTQTLANSLRTALINLGLGQ